MRFIPLVFIAVFASHVSGFSQFSSVRIQDYGSGDFQASFSRFNDRDETVSVIGTPYIHKDFMFGKLILNDSMSIETMFRYNLIAQNIELILGADTMVFMHPLKMDQLIFMGRKFIYDIVLDYNRGNKYLEGAYLEVLADGSCQLLKKYEKNRSSNTSGIKYAAAQTTSDAYQLRTQLYIRLSEEDAPIRVKRIHPRILQLFESRRNELEKFRKENKLQLRSERDLITLIEYYNELSSASL